MFIVFWISTKPSHTCWCTTLGNQWFLRRDNLTHFAEKFLECPHCITPWYYIGDPVTQFLHHQVSCQGHFCPCGPCHSLKRLLISPRSSHKHTLLNAVMGGKKDFAAGMGIENSEHVLCCPGEHWQLKGDWSILKVDERMEKTDQFFFFSYLHIYLERWGKKCQQLFQAAFFGKWQSILVCRKQLLPL